MTAPAVQAKGSAVQDLEMIVTPPTHLGRVKEEALADSYPGYDSYLRRYGY